jgi:hypothetical protein
MKVTHLHTPLSVKLRQWFTFIVSFSLPDTPKFLPMLQEGDLPAGGWPDLKQLTVYHRTMQPALLTRLTALERLKLTGCHLLTEDTVRCLVPRLASPVLK